MRNIEVQRAAAGNESVHLFRSNARARRRRQSSIVPPSVDRPALFDGRRPLSESTVAKRTKQIHFIQKSPSPARIPIRSNAQRPHSHSRSPAIAIAHSSSAPARARATAWRRRIPPPDNALGSTSRVNSFVRSFVRSFVLDRPASSVSSARARLCRATRNGDSRRSPRACSNVLFDFINRLIFY